MVDETTRNREGSRIRLFWQEPYAKIMRRGQVFYRQVLTCRESPQVVAEELFIRYQFARYRGVDLGLLNNPVNFFRGHKWAGLDIEAGSNTEGGISSLYKTQIERALRSVSRRTPEFLGREAEFILGRVEEMKSFHSYTEQDYENWRLAGVELGLAFENLRRDGKIR